MSRRNEHRGHTYEDQMLSEDYDPDFMDAVEHEQAPQCNRCGSTDVRWRQQGGRWVLFSSKPGVEHVCPITDDFEVLP